MNDPKPHATWFDDAHRIIDVTRQRPGLPIPTISPARATFRYTDITRAEVARTAVISAAASLGDAFKVTFTERTETAGDGTPRYLLEALLLSGLTLVIVSRFGCEQDQDAARETQLAGVAA